jgi:hypothetical protein
MEEILKMLKSKLSFGKFVKAIRIASMGVTGHMHDNIENMHRGREKIPLQGCGRGSF